LTKKFTENIFILIILNLLVKPFFIFGIDRNIQNRVGAEQYGMYFSLLGFSLLFNIISDFGVTNYNNRNIAQNHDLLPIELGNLIPLKIILGGLYCIINLIIAFFIGYSSEQFHLLIWLIINQVIISFTLYLRSNISGLQFFNTDSIVSVIDKLILILICVFLLWGNTSISFKIEWFIYAQTLAYTVSLLVALIILHRRSGKVRLKLKYNTSIETLKKSFPFAVLMFLMVMYTRIDAVLLERILPDGKIQAGVYAQAYRMIDALAMFAYLFASILLPLFAKMIKDQKSLIDILSHSSGMLFIPSIGIIVALLFYSKEFMGLLYHQHIDQSAIVLQYLVIGFAGICFSYIFGTLLTASGNLNILNSIAFAGFVTNIVLNILLIPKYGSAGAAFCNMITQLAMGLSQILVSLKIFRIAFNYLIIGKYCLLISLIIGFSIILHSINTSWYFSIITIPVFSIVIGFFLRLLRIDNFKVVFNSR
jgi:O-antigen/teichoic acid export membrane protein